MGRTVTEQIKSGVHLGIGFGSFLIAATLLGGGMNRVVWPTAPSHHVVWDPIWCVELLAAALILLFTADVWWQLLAGYMFFGCIKGVLVFVTGRDLFGSHDSFPRLESAGLTMFAVAALALLFRFAHARPTIIDRIALTIFVFCFVWSAATARFSAVNPLLVAGLIVLSISWVVSWSVKGNHKNVHLPHISDWGEDPEHEPAVWSACVNAVVERNEVYPERPELFERVDELAQTPRKSVIAIDQDAIELPPPRIGHQRVALRAPLF